ncbi:hypothetical protein K227x_00650 [Rubripirellula lacrimiformis]|uniref:Uncharacterized protein n=1 Tax=Rubripirellula lacrimiformis TaxID=1930273 RepID=A0A517N3X8_9BACT|nr:hypothetical protein [Rubripirellula lacrimiformis]QDT01698.1 hypothetical protein K227x_00650 [Rubripirellula lacrimiformis]
MHPNLAVHLLQSLAVHQHLLLHLAVVALLKSLHLAVVALLKLPHLAVVVALVKFRQWLAK